MNLIYVPVNKPEDWQALLAEPDKHWKPGYSAVALAQCWMEAEGFPQSVRRALSGSGIGVLADAHMLVGIPEHRVPLPGGSEALPERPGMGRNYEKKKHRGMCSVGKEANFTCLSPKKIRK
jgi:hypothetical protein